MPEPARIVYDRVEVPQGTAGLIVFRPDSNGHMTFTWLHDVSPIVPRLETVDRALLIARLRAWADLLDRTPTDAPDAPPA